MKYPQSPRRRAGKEREIEGTITIQPHELHDLLSEFVANVLLDEEITTAKYPTYTGSLYDWTMFFPKEGLTVRWEATIDVDESEQEKLI